MINVLYIILIIGSAQSQSSSVESVQAQTSLESKPVLAIKQDVEDFKNSTPLSTLDIKTVLAIKQDVEDFENSIPVGISTFKQLVLHSKAFIDSTRFISDVLESRDSILILSPRSWGRTLNLDMLKTFLEFELNEKGEEIFPKSSGANHILFTQGLITHGDGTVETLQKPLLIAEKADLLKEHLGRHSVIYINFTDTVGENFTVVKRKMELAVARTFKQHEYLVGVYEELIKDTKREGFRKYNERMLTRFRQYLNAGSTELSVSIEFLAKLLFKRFGEKIFILIDEYDKPLHSCFECDNFPKYHCDKILKYLNSFLERVVTYTPHREQQIVTGTFEIASDVWNPFVWHHVCERRGGMQEYFGFRQQLVHDLFEKQGVSKSLRKQANLWYGGYENKYPKFQSYNPKSIVEFLKRKEIDSYGVNDKIIPFVQKVLTKVRTFRNITMSLLSKQEVPFKRKILFEEVFRNFSEIWQSNTSLTARGKHVFFMYLIRQGYLVDVPNPDPHSPHSLNLYKLPNNEVAFVMAKWMISYYKCAYHINEQPLQKAAIALRDFIKSEQKKDKSLRKYLQVLYNNSATQNTSKKESSVQSIMNCVTLRMQRLTRFQMDIYYNRIQTADIVIIDHRRQQEIVIELTEEGSTAREYEYNSISEDIHTLILVGIRISSDKSVTIVINTVNV